MITVYELRYSQNGGIAEDGPAIATLWQRPVAFPDDCVVVPVDMPEHEAERVCE